MFLAGFNCGHHRPHIRTASSTRGPRKRPDRAKQPGLSHFAIVSPYAKKRGPVMPSYPALAKS